MFRIDMRQIQGHITKFGQFSAELTDLAEVVVEAVTELCYNELRPEFGEPRRVRMMALRTGTVKSSSYELVYGVSSNCYSLSCWYTD